ncbi:B3 domain-containing transcription factor NGA4-like [Herrania umbratica]|uniref:B3 domain-containing transcription factor NGA4-like n=1 Tax=Herrania umbratica TaxID=108875 RepID=A0A6J1AJQ5_9ROSI|nr:B3 domain-containing transcription factor NGA4-like [Herrania umbratica]
MAIVLKNLKKTDIEKRLTIPSRALPSFPPLSDKHMVDFAVRDEESGHVWKFRIYTRKNMNNNKYLKPVLTKGWREFVCSKKLKVGDRVAFYSAEEQAGAVEYRVKVQRPLKIFGAMVFPSEESLFVNVAKKLV